MRRHVLDPSLLPDFEYLRTVHQGDVGVPTIGGRSVDDKTWLVVFMDGGPLRYYVYDRAARRTTFLFSESKALDALPLAHRNAEVIQTRDGLQLPADLYLPPSADPDGNGRPRKPLPLLLYVHGGSWGAYPWNSWFTNRCLQLLANRGAVPLVKVAEVEGVTEYHLQICAANLSLLWLGLFLGQKTEKQVGNLRAAHGPLRRLTDLQGHSFGRYSMRETSPTRRLFTATKNLLRTLSNRCSGNSP